MTLLPESDPSAIRLVTPQSVAASRDGVILIDKTEAGKIGPLEIEVTVSGEGERSRSDLDPYVRFRDRMVVVVATRSRPRRRRTWTNSDSGTVSGIWGEGVR